MQIFKKVNAKCKVKGCRSTGRTVDTFYISRSSGFGPSVIICKECIKRAYAKLPIEAPAENAENTETTEAPIEEAVYKTPEKAKKADA